MKQYAENTRTFRIASARSALILWTALLVLLGGAGRIGAQDAAPEEELHLDPITVTATRTPERLGDVADSVEVFAPSRIESLLPGDAAEFLTEAAGVSLPRTSGRGGQTSLFLRGSEGNFTSVLLDGFKLTYPGGGGYDFSHLSPGWIGSAEVLKGPQSPLYGSDAAAGVVNFLPDIGRPGEAPTFAARFRGGSHSTFEEVFKLKGGMEKSEYAATLSRLDTDGHLPNDGYSRSVGTLALDYFFSDKAKARVLYHVNRNGYDVPGPDHRNHAEPNTSLKNLEQLIGVRASVRPSPWLEFVPRVSMYLRDTLFENKADALSSAFSKRDSSETRLSLDGQVNVRLSGARLGFRSLRRSVSTLGVEWEEEKIAGKSASNFGRSDYDRARRAVSLYAHQQLRFRAGFTLAGGVRVDDFDVGEDAATGKISASWRIPRSGTRIRGALGEGVKRPAFSELLDVYGPGNPNLRSERQKSREIGFDQFIGSRSLKFSATYYENDIEDLIAYSFSGFPGGANYENVRKARIKGAEFSLALVNFHDFSAYASLNAMNAITVDEGGVDGAPNFVKGKALLRRPDWWWSGSITYHPDRWKAALRVNSVSDRRDIDDSAPWPYPRTRNPGFTRVDAALSLDLVKDRISLLDGTRSARIRDFTLELKVNNLLDEDYEEVLNFSAPGAQWFAGFRLAF